MQISGISISGVNFAPTPVPPTPVGQVEFVTSATPYGYSARNSYWNSTTWTVPDGVTSISVVCIGAGGSGRYRDTFVPPVGGSGGGLAYENNISVTPGETLYITYGPGSGGSNNGSSAFYYGSCSTVWRGTPFGGSSTLLCGATGGQTGGSSGSGSSVTPIQSLGGVAFIPGTGSSPSTQTGSGTTPTGGYGTGGAGGYGAYGQTVNTGGGGAGGYGHTGGYGAFYMSAGNNGSAASSTSGGGGGGWATGNGQAGAGGGTPSTGQGSTGTAGTNGTTGTDGGGGSASLYTAAGKLYGGGGGSVSLTTWQSNNNISSGAPGVVRIIWPGSTRLFPSTQTTDL